MLQKALLADLGGKSQTVGGGGDPRLVGGEYLIFPAAAVVGDVDIGVGLPVA